MSPLSLLFHRTTSQHDTFLEDDDLLDDFQPFAFIDYAEDDAPLEDDVLTFQQPLHDAIIYGHPEGEHMIVHLAVPLAIVPLVDLDGDDDDIPIFHVGHIDDDLGDDEVYGITILEIPSPAVSVVDVSSTASTVAPTTPTHVSYPASVPPTPTTPSHPDTPTTDPMHLPGFSHPLDPTSYCEIGHSSHQPFTHTFQDP
ncbi:hypothetical protein Hanom_Chr05g00414711 [Helianthus anomalus]